MQAQNRCRSATRWENQPFGPPPHTQTERHVGCGSNLLSSTRHLARLAPLSGWCRSPVRGDALSWHFFMKLFFAVPVSSFPSLLTAFGSQEFFLHFFTNAVFAAPAIGLPSLPRAECPPALKRLNCCAAEMWRWARKRRAQGPIPTRRASCAPQVALRGDCSRCARGRSSPPPTPRCGDQAADVAGAGLEFDVAGEPDHQRRGGLCQLASPMCPTARPRNGSRLCSVCSVDRYHCDEAGSRGPRHGTTDNRKPRSRAGAFLFCHHGCDPPPRG